MCFLLQNLKYCLWQMRRELRRAGHRRPLGFPWVRSNLPVIKVLGCISKPSCTPARQACVSTLFHWNGDRGPRSQLVEAFPPFFLCNPG
jgi:hypothetical protein